jgi:hypothetical protein
MSWKLSEKARIFKDNITDMHPKSQTPLEVHIFMAKKEKPS